MFLRNEIVYFQEELGLSEDILLLSIGRVISPHAVDILNNIWSMLFFTANYRITLKDQ